MGRVKEAIVFVATPYRGEWIVRAQHALTKKTYYYTTDAEWDLSAAKARRYTKVAAIQVCTWLQTQPGFWPR